jgi:PhnB protein
MAKVSAVPQGMHTVTPAITIKGCAEALEFYKRAFGAEEVMRAPDPSGKFIWHAMMRIGDSPVFMNDEIPGMGSPARPIQLWLYVEGVDNAFKRATNAGCTVMMPLADMFWGDRMGKVTDKWGNEWALAQHVKDPTPEEMERAQKAFILEMSKKK